MMRRLTILFLLFGALLGLTACGSLGTTTSAFSASQIAALKQEGFVQSDEGWEYIASEKLLFGSNEASLLPNARQTVERIARLLVGIDIQKVRVDGHTDATGTIAYNDQLSQRRAQAVAESMALAGMPANGIKVRGLGSRLPVASNQSVEGRAQNRRVALVVTGN